MNGKFMWKKLREYEEEYGVELIFSGDKENAEDRAMMIFDNVTEILLREQAE